MANRDITVGVVGVGRMGSNIARHLQDDGFSVSVVYDIASNLAKSLAEELGCEASDTLAGVTAGSDVVITVVTDDAAMSGIFSDSEDSSYESSDEESSVV